MTPEEADREMFGVIPAWSKQLGIPAKVLRERLKDATPIDGREGGKPAKFYSESDVRRTCADLLKKADPAN